MGGPRFTCYVCSRSAFGWPVRAATTERRRGVVRDINGVRHGTCDPFGRGKLSPAHA